MIIYYIKCVPNGKIYLGQTIRGFKERKREHITRLNNSTHNNKHLLRSWKKYGRDNFEFGVIKKCLTLNDLNYTEQSLIKEFKLNNKRFGFNYSFGGNNKLWSESSKQKAKKSHTGSKKPWLYKAVLVYSINGLLLHEYGNIEIAAKHLKCSPTAIRLCCIGTNPSVKNKICIFKTDISSIEQRVNEYLHKVKRLKPWNNKPISQFNANGTLVKDFTSISEAANLLKLDASSIAKVCRGVNKKSGGYVFKYKKQLCA